MDLIDKRPSVEDYSDYDKESLHHAPVTSSGWENARAALGLMAFVGASERVARWAQEERQRQEQEDKKSKGSEFSTESGTKRLLLAPQRRGSRRKSNAFERDDRPEDEEYASMKERSSRTSRKKSRDSTVRVKAKPSSEGMKKGFFPDNIEMQPAIMQRRSTGASYRHSVHEPTVKFRAKLSSAITSAMYLRAVSAFASPVAKRLSASVPLPPYNAALPLPEGAQSTRLSPEPGQDTMAPQDKPPEDSVDSKTPSPEPLPDIPPIHVPAKSLSRTESTRSARTTASGKSLPKTPPAPPASLAGTSVYTKSITGWQTGGKSLRFQSSRTVSYRTSKWKPVASSSAKVSKFSKKLLKRRQALHGVDKDQDQEEKEFNKDHQSLEYSRFLRTIDNYSGQKLFNKERLWRRQTLMQSGVISKTLKATTGSTTDVVKQHATETGEKSAEERRSLQAERKRAAFKARAASTDSMAPTHFCPSCGRGFLARIGLISHLRTHRNNSTPTYSRCHGHLRQRRTNSNMLSRKTSPQDMLRGTLGRGTLYARQRRVSVNAEWRLKKKLALIQSQRAEDSIYVDSVRKKINWNMRHKLVHQILERNKDLQQRIQTYLRETDRYVAGLRKTYYCPRQDLVEHCFVQSARFIYKPTE